MNNFETTITTNLDGIEGKNLTWTITNFVPTLTNATISITDNKKIKMSHSGAAFVAEGGVHVAMLKGTLNNGEATVTIPLFVHCNTTVDSRNIEYTPFVFKVNPKEGGTSIKPNITGSIPNTFALDYRRSFSYITYDIAKNKLTSQSVNKESGNFITKLWEQNAGLSKDGAETKGPLGFYSGVDKLADLTKNHIGYVNNTQGISQYSVTIIPETWKVGEEYANGFFRGQMTFVDDYTSSNVNNGAKIFPLMIWLDPDYYPVTE